MFDAKHDIRALRRQSGQVDLFDVLFRICKAFDEDTITFERYGCTNLKNVEDDRSELLGAT